MIFNEEITEIYVTYMDVWLRDIFFNILFFEIILSLLMIEKYLVEYVFLDLKRDFQFNTIDRPFSAWSNPCFRLLKRIEWLIK